MDNNKRNYMHGFTLSNYSNIVRYSLGEESVVKNHRDTANKTFIIYVNEEYLKTEKQLAIKAHFENYFKGVYIKAI